MQTTDSDVLASTPRHELVALALEAGIERPDQLSMEQLIQAIHALGEANTVKPKESAGSWLSVARHLLATVVEQGLNLPQAAAVIRTVGLGARRSSTPRQPAPLPTVTLAQIYLAQGHEARAQTVLEQVLRRQPENTKARQLLNQLNAAERPNAPKVTPAVAGSTETVVMEAATATTASVLPASEPEHHKQAASDELVVLLQGETGHVCWELGATSSELALDHGLELHVKEFVPGKDGVRVFEQCFPVTTTRGAIQIPLCDDPVSRGLVRAALIAPFSSPPSRANLVLAVASLHRIEDNQPPVLAWAPRASYQRSEFPVQALYRIQG